MILHAGLIARFEPPVWRGVLIQGPSGAGKSDLALRAIAAGWVLVADDRTLIWACDGLLFGRAAEVLAGQIEVRGLGVLPMIHRAFAEIALVVALAEPAAIERLPGPEAEILLGIHIPRVNLSAFEPSATTKLGHALSHLGLRPQRAYQADRAGVPSARRGRGPLRVQA